MLSVALRSFLALAAIAFCLDSSVVQGDVQLAVCGPIGSSFVFYGANSKQPVAGGGALQRPL